MQNVSRASENRAPAKYEVGCSTILDVFRAGPFSAAAAVCGCLGAPNELAGATKKKVNKDSWNMKNACTSDNNSRFVCQPNLKKLFSAACSRNGAAIHCCFWPFLLKSRFGSPDKSTFSPRAPHDSFALPIQGHFGVILRDDARF